MDNEQRAVSIPTASSLNMSREFFKVFIHILKDRIRNKQKHR